MKTNYPCIYKCQNENNPIVEILMLTYNHEKFIEEALQSILMQKTSYSYKIKIGEDCSTDSTRKIVMDYYNQYPDKIELYLWEKNVGSNKNAIEIMKGCKGKYFICIEGDDYWTDPLKLEKQISFLEEHSEYIGTAHNIKCVDKNGELLHCDFGLYPILEEHIYGRKQAENFELVSQTTSLLYRNIWKDWSRQDLEELFLIPGNGDIKISILLGLSGDIYFFRDIMAAHRRVFTGESWTAKTHSKNMIWYNYVSYCSIWKYMKEHINVSVNTNNMCNWLIKDSWMQLLCNFNKENIITLGRLLKNKIVGV